MHVGEIPDDLVAASPLVVIRAKSAEVEPAYLAWYINQPEGQHQLHRVAAGTSLQSVTVADVRALQVKLPSLEVQRAIAEVAKLGRQERELMAAIAEQRDRLLYGQLSAVLDNS